MSRFLLLHGFAGSHESFEHFSRLLPRGATVWAPNLFGHGGPEQSSLAVHSFAAEVERLLVQLEARRHLATQVQAHEPWHVVGYSLGGRVALGMALAQADRGGGLISRVTLVGANPGLAKEAERGARCISDDKWGQLIEQEGIAQFLVAWRAQRLFASQAELSDAVLERQRRIALGHDSTRLAAAMRTLSLGRMPYYGGQLDALGPGKDDSSVRVTLDWVAGSLDAKFSQIASRWAEASGGQFYSVAEIGHNVLLEAPEELARIVLRAQ